MIFVFQSILKDEIASFLEFFQLSVPAEKTFIAYRKTLSDFDSFLYIEGRGEKQLDPGLIQRWLDGFKSHPRTKNGKLSQIRRFSGFLSSLGIRASLPERNHEVTDFAPYVYTGDEMARIFEAADDLALARPRSRIAAEFPMLVRILYGCGLRLGEAISLTWDEVDLDGGVIMVRQSKNQKQRIVPMSDELTRILKLYMNAPCFEMQEHGFLFKKSDGSPRTTGAYWNVFDGILCDLGIKNPRTAKYGARGPCVHSLRHTFTLRSFLKAESEGRGFMETVPFLSTYLGHNGLMRTDVYLRARHEMYTEAHAVIADYTDGVFPEDV
ncbi:MAG: tyrosine-type recombinase/integrase [Clostridiales Family XIII bacterium]|jgi:integrase|nr:tyrosine-type recombinase/integrase [Clostridiales Family XIII bacterium]